MIHQSGLDRQVFPSCPQPSCAETTMTPATPLTEEALYRELLAGFEYDLGRADR